MRDSARDLLIHINKYLSKPFQLDLYATRIERVSGRIYDALPFLHEADSVAIVEIYGSDGADAAQEHIDDVAHYLGQHKIKAGPKITLRRKGSDAAQLIRVAQDAGADLLVTGAYGHSRLGEWIFGGMTRELLASSPICCLMSH